MSLDEYYEEWIKTQVSKRGLEINELEEDLETNLENLRKL